MTEDAIEMARRPKKARLLEMSPPTLLVKRGAVMTNCELDLRQRLRPAPPSLARAKGPTVRSAQRVFKSPCQ